MTNLSALLLSSCLLAAAVTHAEEQTIEVDAFEAVKFSLPFDVEFVQSDEPFVHLSGDQDVIDRIEVEVDGDTLKVGQREKRFGWWGFGNDSGDLSVTIGYTYLEQISLAGSGDGRASDIEADQFRINIAGSASLDVDGLISDRLYISIAGSGNVNCQDVDAEEVTSKIAGSGDVELDGTTVSQEVSITGSGDHSAAKLRSVDSHTEIIGSGDISVWAEGSLYASIMGSGDIRYYGDPEVDHRIRGSGDIDRRGDRP